MSLRPFTDYWTLAARRPGLIGFGVLACFSASFGQTFFIAIFGPELRRAFDLSNGGFGAVYSAATLLSAAVLLVAGRLVDTVPTRRLAFGVYLGLAGAGTLLALTPAVPVLFLALFGLRFFGQGMGYHLAITTMAKRFGPDRGKAISAAALGAPLGETLLPPLAVLALANFGWRGAWLLFAAVDALLLAPALRRLVRDLPALSAPDGGDGGPVAGLDVGAALRGWRFYLLVPAAVAPGFIITAVFFHQGYIVALRGWSPIVFAGLFSLYAAASITASLVAGALVDRFGAKRVAPFGLGLLVSACLVLAAAPSPLGAALAMALFGTAQGAHNAAFNALWVEIYGTAHLGAIRALAQSIAVFGTALSPILVGLAFDAGYGVAAVGITFAGFAGLTCLLLVPVLVKSMLRVRWRGAFSSFFL